MKKIIQFRKELMFKTRVSEITSISLEHQVLNKDDDLISGEFLLNGQYKMTEGSINKEDYNFVLPFDIALNSKYDIDSIKIDIDNFYYEIQNSESLRVSIDLLIEAMEKPVIEVEREEKVEEELPIEELPIEELPIEEEVKENEFIETTNDEIVTSLKEKRDDVITNSVVDNDISKEVTNNVIDNNISKEVTNNVVNLPIENINTNIFSNNDVDTYSTYYVYIVKEDDTIDKILDKYSITKEELENYNDIENIKPFDKIIIPTNGN